MKLVVGITGATGVAAAEILLARSPWPVWLIASEWGKKVCQSEGVDLGRLASMAEKIFDDDDLAAPPASGSVPTVGMVIWPCSASTMAKVAAGVGDSLIARAAHCHLKERRPLVLGLRETPLSAIDLGNAHSIAQSGGVIMPMSPPFYMYPGRDLADVSAAELITSLVDRVLQLLGHNAARNWETIS